MPRLIVPVLIAALPCAATAQSQPSWWDLISPDRILRSVAQSGIMALRTQMDVTYSDMAIDLAAGRVALTDVRVWPLPEWDANGDCEIAIDRLTLRTAALDEADRLRFKLQASGVSAPAVCLPQEPRGALAMAGLDGLEMPRLTIDLDYDVRASDAAVQVFATVTDVATATLTVDIAYISVDGRYDMEDPEPVVFLDDASLVIENLGIWNVLQGMAPPEVTNPASAALVAEGAIGGMLAGANRSTAPDGMQGDPSALTEAQAAFVQSIATTWPAFLANPDTIVIETNINGDVYLDFALFEDDPRYVFDKLRPVVALAPASAGRILPADLLRQAMGGDVGALSDEQRRSLGLALMTGAGAPRNIEAGMALLSALAEAGDGEAAMALSDALAVRAPEDAYLWALRAGAEGVPGATARLDRIEGDLGLAATLRLQEAVSGDDQQDPAMLGSVAMIREQAAMRQSGRGMTRSYRIAAMWAMIGAAAGDAEAADILADLDEKARRADAEGQAAWVDFEAEASRLAMKFWLGQDLPARFRP